MLSLLIINMLTLTSNTQLVKAWSGSIKILQNGSLSPSDAPIQRNGNLYTLTDNITSILDGITIMRKNAILDGAGYVVQGSGSGTGISLINTINVTVRNMEIREFYYGVVLDRTSYSNIYGNKITTANWGEGIYIMSSSSHNIIENNILTNNGDGIYFSGPSSYNVISGNTIRNNYFCGIWLSGSNNHVYENNIEANYYYGVWLFQASGNSMLGNNITATHGNGIFLYSSSSNIISGNKIANNFCGIYLESSSDNAVCHNNFIDNTQQAYAYNSVNVWDDDYPSGGNYWSNYGGVDLNNDGIGDTSYVLDASNVDRYPHMTALALASAIFLQPLTVNTQVDATFSVNIMACGVQNLWAWQAGVQWDPTMLEYVSCSWGEFQTLAGTSEQSSPTIDTVMGSTSKPAFESALRGSFAPVSAVEIKLLTATFKVIKAGNSSIKPTDVSLRSQNPTGTTTYSRWSDVDADGVVDTDDVTFTKQCWEGGYYDQAADFNDDGVVDITDLSIVTSDFGKHSSDPEWGVTNTICGIPSSTMNTHVHALPSEAYISVPYHYQFGDYFCGPATLEMIFDYYGPDISQFEIGGVARTTEEGTYTFDMVRAAHFSNLSTSPSSTYILGYTARKLGYAALERGGMTIDDLKSLIVAGYPIICLGSWHFRVAVGYDSNYIILHDPLNYRGPNYKMTYDRFSSDWDYSGHWGLLISPWNIKVSNARNVLPGDVFGVTATITYPWAPPFPKDQYPASMVNATITLPAGLTLVPDETTKKPIGIGVLAAGDSVNVTWIVQAQSLGDYAISVEAEGKVAGFVPPIPPDYPEYNYEDRIGGVNQSIVVVTSSLDESPPTTVDNYDGLWHNQNFKINLTAEDDMSGVMETYYRINNGPVKTSSLDGQPYITIEGINNTLEYWSVDWAGNEEVPHKFLFEIKLDNTNPIMGEPARIPSGDVQPSQEVKVSVGVTDATSGIKNATLFYTVNNGITWKNQVMNYNISTSLYEATIPCQPDGTLVKFKIVAYDNVGNMAVKDNSGKYYSYQVKAIYELTITTTPDGTTSPSPGTYFYQSGTIIYVNAIPNNGYKLDYWRLDNVKVSSANSTTVLMNENHTLRAFFMHISPPPVGGYSFLIEEQMTTNPLTPYIFIVAILTAVFTMFRRKKRHAPNGFHNSRI